jgi:nitroreductase
MFRGWLVYRWYLFYWEDDSSMVAKPCILIRHKVDALEALHKRVSSPRLSGEVDASVLANIFRAALRAPDHAQLRPWRFLTVSGESRQQLGELFARARLQEDPSLTTAELLKVKNKPMRAPMLIVAIVSFKEHPKVPEVEQILSTGAAVQNMLVAAFAQGVGAMWRTGSLTYNKMVIEGLGLVDGEAVAGFLYLGEPEGSMKTIKELDIKEFTAEWSYQPV